MMPTRPPLPAHEPLRCIERRRWLLGAGIAALAGPASLAAASAPATVAAASDLKFALEELAADFERRHGQRLRLVFGSSGQFHAQILQGAPFHLYLAADEDYVLRLAEAGRTRRGDERGRVYAIGRIGLYVPAGSPLAPDGELRDLADALRDGRLRRLAIANPEHAPYGARAREALQQAGLWPALQGRLVLGENVAQAAQFALAGATQGAIVALALARAPQLAEAGRFGLIPESFHRPLVQRMVLLREAPPAAVAFYEFLGTSEAQAVLRRHGFGLPAA